MVFEFFDKINGFSESINIQLLLTTLLFMIMGFIYFIFRIRRLSQPLNIEENNVNNYNQNINNNHSNYQSNNINNNINNNVRTFHIVIQIERDRHNFDIRITDNIGQFIREKIYPLTNNRQVYLFYQGQLLNQNQQFSFYEHRLSDNMVIICKIRENANRNNLNNNHYNDNMDEIFQDQLRNDPRAVSIYSIYTHIFIIIILGFIIFSYKTMKEIFTKQTILMTQLLCIIWAISFSNTVTKLFFYKKIYY
jgi:hypothetical protein